MFGFNVGIGWFSAKCSFVIVLSSHSDLSFGTGMASVSRDNNLVFRIVLGFSCGIGIFSSAEAEAAMHIPTAETEKANDLYLLLLIKL